jgi:hypothetical protein
MDLEGLYVRAGRGLPLMRSFIEGNMWKCRYCVVLYIVWRLCMWQPHLTFEGVDGATSH